MSRFFWQTNYYQSRFQWQNQCIKDMKERQQSKHKDNDTIHVCYWQSDLEQTTYYVEALEVAIALVEYWSRQLDLTVMYKIS